MTTDRVLRVLAGIGIAAAWVVTDAAPWVADRVMPDYDPRGQYEARPEVVQAYAQETAREAILAGALSLIVFVVCLWLVFARTQAK